jgi:predicted nucleic acid-binding protein
MSGLAVLIDTDVLIDFLTDREPFTTHAKEIIRKSQENKISAFLAAHSVTNIFYILRKIYPSYERRLRLMDLCRYISVVEIGYDVIFKALANDEFGDMEDCLQAECAIVAKVDYIVTRNIKHYARSVIPAILPGNLLKMSFSPTNLPCPPP